MDVSLDFALAALEDLKDELHRRSNKAYFASRFVTAVDFGKQEATVRNCIELLCTLRPSHAYSLSTQDPESLAG